MTTATATVATDTAAVVRTRKPDPRTQVFAEANVEVWSVTGREPRYEILKDGVEAHRIVATRKWRAEQALAVTIGKALVAGAAVAQAVQDAALMSDEAAAAGQPPIPPPAPVATAAAEPDPQPSNGVPIAKITVAKVPADRANSGGQPAKRTRGSRRK